MKTRRLIFAFVLAVFAAIALPFCDVPDFRQSDDLKITLIWNKSYDSQTRKDVLRGLIWDLSWLGAELPKGSFQRAVSFDPADSTRFTIALDSVGFNEEAMTALAVICDSIRRSDEYKRYNGIDVGKFVTLTLGSAWHYYEITGAPRTLKEFKALYSIDSTSYVYGVTKSSISEGHRRILFSRDTALFRYGFLAEEGSGSLDSGSFEPHVYECFDIMPNGQLRFMVYSESGSLISGTPQDVGDAGKPGKCLWCHEVVIQPLFIENRAVSGMLTDEEFLSVRDSMQARLERYRLSLNTDMNWSHRPDHTLGELLYITYLEPSLMHMVNEWGLTEPEAKALLKHTDLYRFKEFDYIGNVYVRSSVDAAFHDSLRTIEHPVDVRETTADIDYFHGRY